MKLALDVLSLKKMFVHKAITAYLVAKCQALHQNEWGELLLLYQVQINEHIYTST